jgi:hypothetical protein
MDFHNTDIPLKAWNGKAQGGGALASRLWNPGFWISRVLSPARHARQAKRKSISAESAEQQRPGRKPWDHEEARTSPERATQICDAYHYPSWHSNFISPLGGQSLFDPIFSASKLELKQSLPIPRFWL